MATRFKEGEFPIAPPIEPMLAKLADELPPQGEYLYEPKWDGFRAIGFRGASELFIQSRDLRPFDRYFPELHDALLKALPPRCVRGLSATSITATRRSTPIWLAARPAPWAWRMVSIRSSTSC